MFIETGVEEDELDYNIMRLDLTQDEAYKRIAQEVDAKMEKEKRR